MGKAALAQERLRRRYQPARVKLLFVGESPPASGRFFYQADSGLYRAIRETFVEVFPDLHDHDFLSSFRDLDCYLVDLCEKPVDRLSKQARQRNCVEAEVRFGRLLERLRPEIVVTVVRSIAANVRRAELCAQWKGSHFELPYPARWLRHRLAFQKALAPILRRELSR